MLKKYFHKTTTTHILFLCIAVAVLFLVAYATRGNQNYKNEWQLFKAPESAVELYFTDHEALPKKYIPGAEAVVSFTIVTHDMSVSTYPYEIVQEGGPNNSATLLHKGEVRINANQTYMENVPIVYGESSERTKISIRLPNQQQAIHYWVDKQQ